MKLVCEKNILLEYINIVNKAVAARTTMPVLECILLTAEAKGFTMTANNLELGIQTAPIPSSVSAYGEIAIEAKIFHEIIRRLNGDEVTLETDEKNTLIITGGTSRFQIMGQSGEDFPALPEVEQTAAYTLKQDSLRNIIRQTIFSISQDMAKPILTGELFELKDQCLQLVSIDGYRISFRKSELSHNVEEKKVVVPGKTLLELTKILSQEEEDTVSLYFTDKHVLFDLGTAVVVSRLLEGEFISYENNFTEDYKTKINVDREELIHALERASLVSGDSRKTPVRLELKPNVLVITAKSDMGTAYEEVPNETDGDELVIAFNPRYLIEALRAIEDERVSVRFIGSLSPCTIAPIKGRDYQYLILPLRM